MSEIKLAHPRTIMLIRWHNTDDFDSKTGLPENGKQYGVREASVIAFEFSENRTYTKQIIAHNGLVGAHTGLLGTREYVYKILVNPTEQELILARKDAAQAAIEDFWSIWDDENESVS